MAIFKNRNKERSQITDIKINKNSEALYTVTLKGQEDKPMTRSELTDYINETSLKNKKDKKIKNNDN